MRPKRLRRGLLRLVHRRRWSRLTLEEVVRSFDTPEKVNEYMQVCFEYVSDHELHREQELWQPPRRTFELKRGDCEDFALFAWHVLRLHGRDAHLFAVFTEHTGHAVCAFEEAGRYHTICNEGLVRRGVPGRGSGRRPAAAVGRELAESIYPRIWISCAFVDRLGFGPPRDDGVAERCVPFYRWIYPE